MKATNSYFFCMTTALMQSLSSHSQTERHLLLSRHETYLKWSIKNHIFCILQWGIKQHQRCIYPWIQKNMESMQQKEQFKCSKITSSVVYFQSNFSYATMGTTPTSVWKLSQHAPYCTSWPIKINIALHDNHNFNFQPWVKPGCKAVTHNHAQKELIHGTLDQQRSLSMLPSKFLNHTKGPTMGLYYVNSWGTIYWNYQTKKHKSKRIIQTSPSIGSNYMGQHSSAPATPTVPTASTALYSPTHNDTVTRMTQMHQQHTHSNTAIMPTMQCILPDEPKQSPHLQHQIITQNDDPMAVNFFQHQVWHNYLQHPYVILPPQTISNIPSVEQYAKPEKGETITTYKKLAQNFW